MHPSSRPIRILLADDHGVMRAGLRALLNAVPEFDVVGEASTSAEALQMAELLHPDIAVLDVNMPGAGGIEVVRRINTTIHGVRTLILTVYDDEGTLREALDAGATGYLVKQAAESELIAAVRAVYRGDLYVHPHVTAALLRSIASERQAEARTEKLTPREAEVLRHIALGYTNREIATLLHISVRTVETHRANLIAKLHLDGRAALVRYAKDHGLLED